MASLGHNVSTLKVPKYMVRSHQLFWLMLTNKMHFSSSIIYEFRSKYIFYHSHFMSTDGPTPVGAGTSAGTVMATFLNMYRTGTWGFNLVQESLHRMADQSYSGVANWKLLITPTAAATVEHWGSRSWRSDTWCMECRYFHLHMQDVLLIFLSISLFQLC